MSEWFQTGFRLGDCSVEPRLGQIERSDGVEHVTPKAMEILLCLVTHPEDLVEREELIRAGWGGGEGHDEALTRSIAELRHALGDHHDQPTYIQTVPRRGYRLVAPVDTQEGVGERSSTSRDNEPTKLSFWAELKRREVVRNSVAYIAGAWLAIEVFSVIAPIFSLPHWMLRTLVVMAIVGVPIVMALSWALQITPSGLTIDMPVEEGATSRGRMTGRKADMIIIATLIVAVSFLTYREFRPDGKPTPEFSIAVLPFDNLSDSLSDGYLGDGLAEELLNLLAQTADLDVTSRKASFFYKNKDVPLRTIIDTLGVRNIVEGSVQRYEERIRITVQLIDGQSLTHRWSESYDASEPDLIAVRDSIAREVASELETVITERGQAIMARDADTDRRAYLLYWQAREQLRQEHNDETLGNAERLLNEAIRIDPNFASAFAGLCDTNLAQYSVAGREQAYFTKAEEACQRALALDEGLVEVYVALGNLYRESGELTASLQEFEQALSLDPEHFDAINGIAQTLDAQGSPDAAEEKYKMLARLEPGYWQSYNAMGHFYYSQSRFAEAAFNFRRATLLAPGTAIAYNNLGAAYYMQGDYVAAVNAWEDSVEIRPSNLVLSNIGLAAYYTGDYEKAASMQQQAIDEYPEDFRIWGRLGDAHRQARNDNSAAMAYSNALLYASRAIERNPSDEETLRYLSLYYSHTGNNDAAINTIERARTLRPESSRVYYFASKVYLLAGDTKRAAQELEQALSMGYSMEIATADPDFRELLEDEKIRSLTGRSQT